MEAQQPIIKKIRHPRCWEVFVERQTYGKWICHTGISLFVPGEFDTMEAAIAAVDAKLDALKAS